MDFSSVPTKSNPHQRTIVHLDMDYFYAQVEEIRKPSLRSLPLGVQQKNIVVTCNYIAREFGVAKLMSVQEAKRLCPQLELVNGEDLTPYREMSQRIFELLLNYTPLIEKLGFDENYLDVSNLVELREQEKSQRASVNDSVNSTLEMVGNIYPPNDIFLDECICGCARRLAIGTKIAQEIRDELRIKLGITCCAGISFNKLLAKLVGAQNKPNDQTVLVSTRTNEFMRSLKNLHRVTGIGQKTESLLIESGINTIEELQNCEMNLLRKKFGYETATKLKDLSIGRDMSAVRPTGKPKTIGLEDSCRPISVRTDVEDRFRLLLMRLVEQVAEDGRIPVAIKVILRKFDPQKKTSHRETRQTNILPSLFKASGVEGGSLNNTIKVMLAEGAQEKILKIIMRLFERVVDMSKPFNITLIGLAFSKFQQRKLGSSSIANFLIKKTDLEVQSITSITNTSLTSVSDTSLSPSISSTNSNNESFRSSPTTFQPSDQFYHRRRTNAASPIPMLVDNGSESGATNSDFSDFSETEVEPSPKKSRLNRFILANRRCLVNSSLANSNNVDLSAEVASPSKLRVSDLRLNSRDSEKDFAMSTCSKKQPYLNKSVFGDCDDAAATINKTGITNNGTLTSSPLSFPLKSTEKIDTECANELYVNKSFQLNGTNSPTLPSSNSYITSMPVDEIPIANMLPTQHNTNTSDSEQRNKTITQMTTITGNLSNIPCPTGVDPQVFNELPLDVQNELIASWRTSLAAAAAAAAAAAVAVSNGGISVSTTPSNTAGGTKSSAAAAVSQKNTLYRYFLRNK